MLAFSPAWSLGSYLSVCQGGGYAGSPSFKLLETFFRLAAKLGCFLYTPNFPKVSASHLQLVTYYNRSNYCDTSVSPRAAG